MLATEFWQVNFLPAEVSTKNIDWRGFLCSTERFELEACVRSQRGETGILWDINVFLSKVMFLFDDGKSCQVIPEGHYWTDDTLGGWHKAYPENGWEAMGGYG